MTEQQDYAGLEQRFIDLINTDYEIGKLKIQTSNLRSKVRDMVLGLFRDYEGEIEEENIIQIGRDTYIVEIDFEEATLGRVIRTKNISALAAIEWAGT